jgi:hypothetical protein
MLTRNFSASRKILLFSLLVGLFAAIAVSGIQFLVVQKRHEQKMNAVLAGMQHWLTDYFSDIKTTAESLQPLTLNECADVASELTSRAAFSMNVRAFLLVKNDNAFCSSATGEMHVPMKDLLPEIDLNKDFDMVILHGTPMMPDKPAIAMWFRSTLLDDRGVFVSLNVNLTPFLLYTSQQQELTGIALGIGNNAISTFSTGLVDLRTLKTTPFRTAHLAGFPLTIHLYTENWNPKTYSLPCCLAA